jgi:mannan polymerase II complex MNN10 subunit
MLTRAVRVPPVLLLLLLVVCAFLGWQFRQHPSAIAPLALPKVDPTTGTQVPRIALVTFITDEKSYIHLSLKNKDRKSHRAAPRRQPPPFARMLKNLSQTMPAVTATTS